MTRSVLGGLLLVGATAAVCFSITAAMGFAGGERAARTYTLRPGDSVSIPSLRWKCNYGALLGSEGGSYGPYYLSCSRSGWPVGIWTWVDTYRVRVLRNGGAARKVVYEGRRP